MVGKLAWSIAMKEDNLWVKWIHAMYIKEHNWSGFLTPKLLVELLNTSVK